MLLIVVYDVPSDRTQLYKKSLQRYLQPLQNSVFSGHTTPSVAHALKKSLATIFENGDAVTLFEVPNRHNAERFDMGVDGRGSPCFLSETSHQASSQVV